MTEIADRKILITGGASGIGRLMALKLARLGGEMVLWDLDRPGLDRVVGEIERNGGRARGYICDVSRRTKVYQTADRVRAEVGDIDIVINNAGVVSGKSLLELPDDKIETTFKVNTLALFWVTKAFLPHMVERDRGHVVTISSAGGLIGVARMTDYSASKFAAVGFDEALRVELKKTAPGVRTTIVCPYYIDTGMFAGVRTRIPLLLPILKPDSVADRVVEAIQHNRARLYMPPIAYTIAALRLLPTWAMDLIANILGINVSMDAFVGRSHGPASTAHLREVTSEQ